MKGLSYYFYWLNIRRNIISKSVFMNINNLPILSKLNIFLDLYISKDKKRYASLQKLYILRYLESLTLVRPVVRRYISSGSDNKRSRIFFRCLSTLRKKNVYFFLDFFSLIFLPIIRKSNLVFSLYSKDFFNLSFKRTFIFEILHVQNLQETPLLDSFEFIFESRMTILFYLNINDKGSINTNNYLYDFFNHFLNLR